MQANNLLPLTMIAIALLFTNYCCLNLKAANTWLVSYGLCMLTLPTVITTLSSSTLAAILPPTYQILILGAPYIIMQSLAPSRYHWARRSISLYHFIVDYYLRVCSMLITLHNVRQLTYWLGAWLLHTLYAIILELSNASNQSKQPLG